MSGYQRFIAYVYEYQKQKKGSSRGHVKVENKRGACSFQIRLQCPGLMERLTCRIYGFLRRQDGIEGVLLGECSTQRDGFQWEIEGTDGSLGESKRSLGEFAGMVFLVEGGGFYGTEWDDQGIVPAQFYEEALEQTPAAEEGEAKNSDAPEMTVPKAEPEERASDLPEGTEPERKANNLGKEAEMTQEAGSLRLETEAAQSTEKQGVKEVPKETDQEDSIMELAAKKIPEPDDWEKDEEEVEAAEMEEFVPFEDGEMEDCRKIEPGQFFMLNRRDWALRSNRFLLYSYRQFGYLFVGRIRGRQQYVLGVPGMYDQQERFMANMFGFTHFKASSQVELPGGKGGYWYRLINPPNFDQRNGRR